MNAPESLLLLTAIGLFVALLAGWRSNRRSKEVRSGRKRYKAD